MALSRVKIWGAETLTAADLNAEFNNIINNASSLISPLSGALDWDGYAHTLDAAGVTTAQSTAAIAWTFVPGSKTGTPGTTGSVSNWAANTYTDSNTAGSGTAAAFTGHAYQRPTLAATNASVTTTNAATMYLANSPLAGTNQTLTNAWSLWVDDGHVRCDGDVHVQADLVATINKYSLTTSVAASALTIALKDRDGNDASTSAPITFKFRSTTGSTGTYTIGTVSAALSTVISSGSTLGTVSGVAHRIHVGALLNGSTVELCYWNSQTTTGLTIFSDVDLTSTTAEGGAGGADSAGVMYSTTARSSVPWVYLGFIETSQVTAGTWAANASKVQTASESTYKPGQIIQSVRTASGAVATGTTAVPIDDSIPQSGEGDQYMSAAITPFSAANWLRISHRGVYAHTVANERLAAFLLQDATANALAVTTHVTGGNVSQAISLGLHHEMTAGTTSSTTFKIRAGGPDGATTTFNGVAGGRLFGGAITSFLLIEEIFS